MREARPGQYVGSGTAGPGTFMVDEPISATLVRGSVRHTMRATTGLTVFARSPAQPTIDMPRPGAAPGSRLVMRGRGPVGYIIEARISYSGRSGSGQRQGVLGELATVVGNTGAWSMIVDPLIAPDGSRLIIAVTAIDPAGQRSASTNLELGEERCQSIATQRELWSTPRERRRTSRRGTSPAVLERPHQSSPVGGDPP